MPTPMKWLVVALIAVSGCKCGGAQLGDAGAADDGGRLLPDGGLSDGGAADAGPIDAGDLFQVCEVAAQAGGLPVECAIITTGACATAADCPMGMCLALATGKVCTQPCLLDADCANARVCERRTTGNGVEGFCVPAIRGGP